MCLNRGGTSIIQELPSSPIQAAGSPKPGPFRGSSPPHPHLTLAGGAALRHLLVAARSKHGVRALTQLDLQAAGKGQPGAAMSQGVAGAGHE